MPSVDYILVITDPNLTNCPYMVRLMILMHLIDLNVDLNRFRILNEVKVFGAGYSFWRRYPSVIIS